MWQGICCRRDALVRHHAVTMEILCQASMEEEDGFRPDGESPKQARPSWDVYLMGGGVAFGRSWQWGEEAHLQVDLYIFKMAA
jgi:hypothetical protein